ncbi:MAG: hypothetical protein PHC74_07510 [Sulfurimonas sp.]|nr:hypothetical protein [Sulfurimonas sp.]
MNTNGFYLLKDIFKIPIAYIKYVWNLLTTKQIIDLKQKISDNDIGYFFISIIMIEMFLFFYMNIYPHEIQIDPIKFFNKVYVFVFFTANAIPLAILFSFIIMIFIKRYTKNIFLLLSNQVIKFFSIVNIIIAIVMILGINELITNNRNMLIENEFKLIYNDHILLLSLTLLSLPIIFYKILLAPLYRLLYKNSKIKTLTLTIMIFILTVVFNQLSYHFLNFYPKVNIENLIDKKQFCKQVINYNIDTNRTIEENLTFQNYNKICKNI